MKNKLALIIAILLGVVAVWGVMEYQKDVQEEFTERMKLARVATAQHSIKAGTLLEMKMMESRGKEVSEDSLTSDYVLNRDKYVFVGQTINRDVERGDPLLLSYFRRPTVRLENTLTPGERAVALSVDTISGVGGSIVPGSHVDILGTFALTESGARATGGADAGRTKVLLANVTVLAVDGRTRTTRFATPQGGSRCSRYSSITVAVTPEEASILVHAQTLGKLTMLLRAAVDAGASPPPEGVTATNLLQRAAAAEQDRRKRQTRRPLDMP